jgi:hypothetical protein
MPMFNLFRTTLLLILISLSNIACIKTRPKDPPKEILWEEKWFGEHKSDLGYRWVFAKVQNKLEELSRVP